MVILMVFSFRAAAAAAVRCKLIFRKEIEKNYAHATIRS